MSVKTERCVSVGKDSSIPVGVEKCACVGKDSIISVCVEKSVSVGKDKILNPCSRYVVLRIVVKFSFIRIG